MHITFQQLSCISNFLYNMDTFIFPKRLIKFKFLKSGLPLRTTPGEKSWFFDFHIFSLSNQIKPPFSLKLEMMRRSKFSTASKNIKNIKSWIYIKKSENAFEFLKIFFLKIFREKNNNNKNDFL